MEIDVDGTRASGWMSAINLIKIILFVSILFAILPADFESESIPSRDLTEGTLLNKVKWLVLFGLSFLIILRHINSALRVHFFTNPFIWVLLFYCAASIVWSPLPVVTLKRTFQYFGVILIGMAVANQLNSKPVEFVRVCFWSIFSLLLASVVMVIVSPSTSIESSTSSELVGAWKGVMSQKNTLGQASAMALFTWVVLQFDNRMNPAVATFTFIIVFLCLIMARSSTAIGLVVASSLAYVILRKNYINSSLWLLRLTFTVSFAILIGLHLHYLFESRLPNWNEIVAPFAEFFGKGADLSGRSIIWKFMWFEVDKHWLTGLGYGSFWFAPPEDFMKNFNVIFYQAHNGYIDILNELGVVGLLLFFGILVFHLFYLYKLFAINQKISAFYSGLLVFYLVSNITETSALVPLNFINLLVIISILLAAHQVAYQHRNAIFTN